MRVLTMFRFFPKGHPKAGQPTYFIEKIWNCFREYDGDLRLPDHFKPWIDTYSKLLTGGQYLEALHVRELKHTTIRAGERFKPGDMVSLRVWSDKPYRSKQIEFAQVEVKKTWQIEINQRFGAASFEVCINGKPWAQLHYGHDADLNSEGLGLIAANDGLSIEDFISWFAIHPKKQGAEFRGQIVSWSPEISY